MDVDDWKKAQDVDKVEKDDEKDEKKEIKPTIDPGPKEALPSVSTVNKEPTPSSDIVMHDTTTDDGGVDDAEVDASLQKATPSVSDQDRSKPMPSSEDHKVPEPGPTSQVSPQPQPQPQPQPLQSSRSRSPPKQANTTSAPVEPITKIKEEDNQMDTTTLDTNDLSQGPTQESALAPDEPLSTFGPPIDTNPEPPSQNTTAPLKSMSPIQEPTPPTEREASQCDSLSVQPENTMSSPS